MPPETGQSAGAITKVKDFFALLREVCIALCVSLFFLSLLCWPETVHNRLQRAGITEVAGVHFDITQAEAAVKKTEDAQKQVAEIQQNVENTKKELADLQPQANPEAQAKIAAINTRLNASLTTVQAAQQNLKVTRQQQVDILQQARTTYATRP